MRILLDESLPRLIKNELRNHDVSTVRQVGWSGKNNGELLQAMADAGFEVLLTADQNLKHQQNTAKFGIAIIVMIGKTNRIEDLLPLMGKVEQALTSISATDIVEITL